MYKVGHYHEIFVFSYSASTRRLGIGIDVQSRTTWVLKSKILLHSKEGSQARIWGPRTAWRASRDYTIIKRKEGKEKERGVTEQTRRELEGDPQIAPKCLHAYLLHPRRDKTRNKIIHLIALCKYVALAYQLKGFLQSKAAYLVIC